MTDNRFSDQPDLFTADPQTVQQEQLDCGIRKLNWCTGATCQKFATIQKFVLILSLAGFAQGAAETYFAVSAKEAAQDYGYDPKIIDWLLVTSGLAQGVFALAIAFWAIKIHPVSWLGSLIMLEAFAAILVIIPTVSNISVSTQVGYQSNSTNLCTATSSASPYARSMEPQNSHTIATLVLLFILQITIGLGNVAYYGIGIGYIDDNTKRSDAPACIGVILAVKIFGGQFGSGVTMVVSKSPLGWWLGWVILAPFLFVFGVLICLFPRKLTKTVVRQAAHKIYRTNSQRDLRIASTNQQNKLSDTENTDRIEDFRLLPSLGRLLTNKPFMFNAIATMFILTAVINYQTQEDNYAQSRFYLPSTPENGLLTGWNNRFISYMIKPSVIAATVLLGGLVVSKTEPAARKIVISNVVHLTVLGIVFIILIFIKCDIGKMVDMDRNPIPDCSSYCACSMNEFHPVCPEVNGVQTTYFSPCQAGCRSVKNMNGIILYDGCSCGSSGYSTATDGACNGMACTKSWIAFQVLNALAASVLGGCFVGKILLAIRVTSPQDKVLGLALGVTFLSIFANVPGKLAYDAISYYTCQYWDPTHTKCLLRNSPLHGNLLNIVSAVLVFLGILFEGLVWLFVKDKDCFKDPYEELNSSYISATTPSAAANTNFDYVSVPKESGGESDIESSVPRKSGTFNEIFGQPNNNVTRQPSAAHSTASSSTESRFPVYAKLAFPQISKEELEKSLKTINETKSVANLDYAKLDFRPMDSTTSFTGQKSVDNDLDIKRVQTHETDL